MVNPYPARIEELHNFLQSRYGQKDRQATEVLLAAVLPRAVTNYRRPWIVIETDYPSRDTREAWFNFGLDDGTERAPVKVRSLSETDHQRAVAAWRDVSRFASSTYPDRLTEDQAAAYLLLPSLLSDCERLWSVLPLSDRPVHYLCV